MDKTDRKTNQKPQGRYVRTHVTPRAKGNRPFRERPLVEPSLEVIHIFSSKQGDALGFFRASYTARLRLVDETTVPHKSRNGD